MVWNNFIVADRSPRSGFGESHGANPTKNLVILPTPAPVYIRKPVKPLYLRPRETRHGAEERVIDQSRKKKFIAPMSYFGRYL